MSGSKNDRLPHALSAAIFAMSVLMFGSVWTRLYDADTGFHLAAGRYILAHGEIPKVDPWSWTAGDYVWANLSWLYDVALASVDTNLGFGLVAGATLVAFALVPMMVTENAIRRGAGPLVSGGWGLMVALVLSETLAVRPHVFTDLFAFACYLLLLRDREGKSGAYLLPVITLLWVNVHGGFALGFGLIGAFGAEALIQRDIARAQRLVVVGLLSVMALLANPLGFALLEGANRSLSMASRQFLIEWGPVILGTHGVPTLWVLCVAVTLLFGWRGVPLAERIMLVALVPLALSTLRHLAPAAVLTAPALALATRSALQRSPVWTRFAKVDDEVQSDLGQIAARRGGIVTVAVLVVAVCTLPSALVPGLGHYPLPTAPIAVYDAAAEHAELRLFSDFNVGGELLALHAGHVRPFVDGRSDTAYPESVMNDYMAVFSEPGAWRTVFDKWQIEAVLLTLDHPIVAALDEDPEWTRTAEAPTAALWLRQ